MPCKIQPYHFIADKDSFCADYSFMQYEQALLAAAGVAAARSICNISPVWPDELAKRLGYSFHDIAKCLDSILSVTKLNSKPSQQPRSEEVV